jgi:hypothetical protein
MESGFVPAVNRMLSVKASRWVEGDPAKGWTGDVKTLGRLSRVISADRCVECGFLELYAG